MPIFFLRKMRILKRRWPKILNIVILCWIIIGLYCYYSMQQAAETSFFPFKKIAQQSEKIDWHDYKLIEEEAARQGLGEHGVAASLGPEVSREEIKALFAANGFNAALSDRISLNRSLPDIRHKVCKDKKYLSALPVASVVVPFHNEHWSTLLRTVHAVLNRSPPALLREVILVDDASDKPFLKEDLDAAVKALGRVQVVRLPERRGLIYARLAGARRAAADVLVFLDAHSEPNVNWLPPLLEPIAEDNRTAVCPYIDVVAYDTFEYRAQDEGARGSFDWELFYKRLPVLPADEANMPEPFKSPVMAGGLFAISRSFFWQLGGYDEQLDIWGGEQYELSFKVWQCGGRMLDAPCSRVGHIYRKFAPYPNPRAHGVDFVGKNYRRVAEVWMDEYKEHLYARRPHYRAIDPGDLTQQRAVRTKLKCKSFRWFMTQIAFDQPSKYPAVEPPPFAEGRIRLVTSPEHCLRANTPKELSAVRLGKCSEERYDRFTFTWHRDLKLQGHNLCLDAAEHKEGSSVLLYNCHLGGGNQLFRYNPSTQQLSTADETTCVEGRPQTLLVQLSPCDGANGNQRWLVDKVYVEEMAKWDKQELRITGPVEHVDE